MKRIEGRGMVVATAVLFLLAVFALPAAGAESGAAIFKAKCAACHGESGAGDTPMGKKLNVKNLGAPSAQNLTDEELFDVISVGKNKMPPFEKRLSPDKIRLVVTHIRSLKRS